MIGMSGQQWAAVAMVAVAAIYLGRQTWRTLRGTVSGPGCCGGDCPSVRPRPDEAAGQGDAKPFVPLDNFAGMARRHKQELDRPEKPASEA
jgi:hypothetical protein